MTRHNNESLSSRPEPIVMSMDFLRHPIFVPGRVGLSDHDGKFFVDGDLATTIVGGILDGDAADVFHALTHIAKQQGFPQGKVKFVTTDLLKKLNLTAGGENYERVRQAIEALYSVSVELEDVSKKYGGSGGWRILTERFVFEKGSNKNRMQSWVEFSPRMLNLFKSGALKAVHPAYFELEEPIDKRIFTLLSVRASDLKEWKVSVLTLRDLIPLLADKAKTPSGAKQQIERNLKRLLEKGIIRSFKFSKPEGSKELFVEVELNPEYFFSSNPTRMQAAKTPTDALPLPRKNASKKSKIVPKLETLSLELISKGIAPRTARALVRTKEEEVIKTQLAHLEYMEKNGRAKENPAGWLIDAIKKGYRAPESMAKKVDEERNQKINFLIEEAKTLTRRRDKKSIELALVKAAEAKKLGSRRADDVIEDAQREMRYLENQLELGGR